LREHVYLPCFNIYIALDYSIVVVLQNKIAEKYNQKFPIHTKSLDPIQLDILEIARTCISSMF